MDNQEDQALTAIMATLGQSDQAPQQPEDTSQTAKPEAVAEATQSPAQEPETPEVEAKQDEEPQTIEIDPDEALFEQEIEEEGKKVSQKLSLKELQQGYLRQKDYTRKTQELARQRDELPRELAKANKELSESYAKRLSELQALVMRSVAEELQGKDLNKLATEDPFEYIKVSNRVNQIGQLLQTIRQDHETESTKRAEEKKKEDSQRWAKSLEILHRDIPDFGPDVVKRLVEAAKEWGFTAEEVGQWNDHRQIKMLHALSQKQSIESKKPEVEKKVALITKTLKPGTKQPARTAIDEAKQRLRKSGKAEDALPIFEAMLR